MSEKGISISRLVTDEDSDDNYDLTVTVDFIATDDVYLSIRGNTYAIPKGAAWDVARFILDNSEENRGQD